VVQLYLKKIKKFYVFYYFDTLFLKIYFKILKILFNIFLNNLFLKNNHYGISKTPIYMFLSEHFYKDQWIFKEFVFKLTHLKK
jgi:hypothetical protein